MIKDAIKEVLSEQTTVNNLENIYCSTAKKHHEALEDDCLLDKIQKLDRKQALKIIGWYGSLFVIILLSITVSITVFGILSMLLEYIPNLNKDIFAFVDIVISFLALFLCTGFQYGFIAKWSESKRSISTIQKSQKL